MAGFSELIKNFGKTADYVRDFFIYGFKVRNDFKTKSSRTYDDEKRRVESWLGDYLRYDNSVRGRQISISVDSGHIPENPLYQAYYSKSFTDNDIKLHFFITDILQSKGELTLKELTELIDSKFGEIFDWQTVRNKLKEYAEEGLIVTEKRGKTAYFSLSDINAGELLENTKGLSDGVKFFSETQHFGIIGNSILKFAGLRNDLFFMKHNYIVHTLEDEILLDIIKAIEEKRLIYITVSSRKADRGDVPRESEYCVIPMQVLSSVQTGRRYLAGIIPKYRRYNSFRLDSIKRVRIGEIAEEYDFLRGKYLKNTLRCFGVSFGDRQETGNVSPLKITFCIDEKTEDFVVQRIKREMRCGSLEKTAENTFVLTEDVYDPHEVMHWIKTFIGRISRIEGGNEAVRRQFYTDIRRMDMMYNKNVSSEAKLKEADITDNKNENGAANET